MSKNPFPQKRFFYGWLIVASSFVTISMATSARYSFPIFMKPLSEEFGWSRAQLGGVMSLNMIIYSLLSPIVGILLDRFGTRSILALGAALLGLGLWSIGSLSSINELYLSFGGITGLGLACAYFVPNFSLARKWFHTRAGLATGIVALGSGLGLAVTAPAVNYFIETLGWRTSVRIVAMATWVLVLPLVLLLVRNDPESVGLRPDGASAEFSAENGMITYPPFQELLASLRSTIFLHLFFLYFVYSLAICGILTHFFLWGTKDLSLPGTLVALALSLQTLFATGSRILGGWLSDRFGRLLFIALSLGGLTVAFALGMITRGSFDLFVFAILFGSFYGLPLAVYPAYVGDLFGRKATGSLYGFIICAGGLAGGLGAWGFGMISDTWGSYQPAYLATLLLLVLSLFSILVLKPAHRSALRRRSG